MPKKSPKRKTKPRPKLSPAESREKYNQLKREAALEAVQAAHDDLQVELDVAYSDIDKAEETALNSAELKSDWEYLKQVAKVEFPEGTRYLGLSPKNRLIAIAKCLDWSIAKIAKASGTPQRTVYNWLKRPDIRLFMDDFNMKQGTSSPDKLVNSNAIKGLKFLETVLNEQDTSESAKRIRFQAALAAIERRWGKPTQPVEHKGETIRQLMDAMAKAKPAEISPKEEKELFTPGSKTVH